MIVTRLKGGLGNQMFQYAAGKALSLHLGTSLKTDGSFFQESANNPDVTPRYFELDCFGLEDDSSVNDKWILSAKRILRSSAGKNLLRLIPFINWKYYQEKSFAFDPRFFSQVGNIMLEGYWQSESYFKAYESEIRKSFGLKFPLSEKSMELDKRLTGSKTVSVHVRRGDLVTNSLAASQHGTCSPAYYREALDRIRILEPGCKVVVFSDEPEFVQNQMQFIEPEEIVNWNQGRNYEDLFLMSRCTHHIIANSSFSWWGAWLNPATTKRVIAPKRWFASDKADTSTLFPDSWIKI